ncbi:hypothetical protein ELE36_14780 [Pseudolysobacter antarcticus]|uniref:Uncharacterized protein n=1 Tax=Pseudolysobacter antarcticus TaxID=2511995 RepID=A0A411HM05_9GAMM|nr:hypothetical protein [Pseudolysobacter antarcticus]QBB71518.1 hypothetical protein ELE36_14780 [Pseudolysobacter antarcticus]
MINLLIPFMALAAIGFLMSLTVHILALAGTLPPGGEAVFGLHIGIFVVWLPAVLVSIRLNRGQRTRSSWKQMLAGCPNWMRYAVMGLFAYAFLNFFIAFSGQEHSRGHGSGISTAELRGFSGHWMLFYGMAFCILFSALRKPWLLSIAKCPAGHEVAHSDTFCPTCGKAIPPRNA